MKIIDCFDGEYAFLSNFYEAPMVVNGITYPTNEHFFQAMKTEDKTMQKVIAAAPTPGKAKRLGRQVVLRDHWDETRLGWMQLGLREKFTQHPELAKKLIATGNALLIEGNHWHDTFWGQCDGVGENHLGALLMMLRDEYTKPYCHWVACSPWLTQNNVVIRSLVFMNMCFDERMSPHAFYCHRATLATFCRVAGWL